MKNSILYQAAGYFGSRLNKMKIVARI